MGSNGSFRLASAAYSTAVEIVRQRLSAEGVDVERRAGGGDPVHRHAVLRERAGLVDAQHGHRAERLHGGNAPGEHAAPGKPPCAERQEHGDDDRKLVREDRHRQREPGEQAPQPVVARETIDHDDGQRERAGDERELPDQPPRFALQRVSSATALPSARPILPISVRSPVAVTWAVAAPSTTSVPA